MAKKLLVIDDEPGIIQVIEMAARQLGWETQSLRDPVGAAETFIKFNPDLLLLDMIMPQKDGIDVLHEILSRQIPVKVVLTSGYGDSYLRLGVGVAKFHHCVDVSVLRKPFRRSELTELLNDQGVD